MARQGQAKLRHGDSSIRLMPATTQTHHFTDDRGDVAEVIPEGWQAVIYSDQLPRIGWHLLGRFPTEQAAKQAVAEWRA
jgi:hypothetical protein